MGYRLVLASGRDGEPKTLIGELLGVLGGGLLFRQMARQLVGLIPIAGIVPKVAIAYGGTWAVGRAVMFWVTEGRPATSERGPRVQQGRPRSRPGRGQGHRGARPHRGRARLQPFHPSPDASSWPAARRARGHRGAGVGLTTTAAAAAASARAVVTS